MSEKLLSGLYDEIIKIRHLLEISLRDSLKKELEKTLSTNQRKAVWALSDGFTDTKTIARRTRLSLRAVQLTLKDLQDADLVVVRKRGYPRRRYDYIPSEWRLREVEKREQRTE